MKNLAAAQTRDERSFFLAQEFFHYNPARPRASAEWVTARRVWAKDGVGAARRLSKSKNPKPNKKRVLKPRGGGALSCSPLNGFSARGKGNNETATAFRPSFFIEYIQSMENLHNFASSKEDLEVLEAAAVNNEIISAANKKRKIIAARLGKKLRDLSFKGGVLTARRNRRAFNGVALSSPYRRARDKALVIFGESYNAFINKKTMHGFKQIGFSGGEKHFLENLLPAINLPTSLRNRPNINFVKEADKPIGWAN